mmetsp:Transcript_22532/g.76068  ORF Transcript_22532/g.76068 Transcript_22532/m.76068 type:complete len:200 (-) Transcript_22532:125-724(-)
MRSSIWALKFISRARLLQAAADQPLTRGACTGSQIVDAAGLSIASFWKSWRFFKAMSKIGSDNYPELLGCCSVVRGVAAGAWVLDQVKRFLDPATAAKIEMASGDPRKALARHLSPADYPPELIPDAVGTGELAKASGGGPHGAKKGGNNGNNGTADSNRQVTVIREPGPSLFVGMLSCGLCVAPRREPEAHYWSSLKH